MTCLDVQGYVISMLRCSGYEFPALDVQGYVTLLRCSWICDFTCLMLGICECLACSGI